MVVEFSLNCSGSWTDYSDFVVVTNLKVTKDLDENNDPRKSITGDIESFGDAYTFLKTNLIDSTSLYSNQVCVRITDDLCGNVMSFKLETNNLKWCDNNECQLRMNLVEYNPTMDCVKNTVISDNTNGEFQTYPVSGTPHPRFKYCDVIKPTFFFGALVTFLNSIDLLIALWNLMLFTVFNPIVVVLNAFFGTSFNVPQLDYLGPFLLGCERVHPAPFVRTYIDNVCNICTNITVNSTTDIPFHDPVSIYYNSCLLTAYTTKGVASGGTKDYIEANRPSWTLFDLLSKIKNVFNARWFLKDTGGGTYELHFARKDLLGTQLWGASPSVDLSATGSDHVNLLGNVCYSWNGQGKPSRINMKYSQDPGDNIGNELLCRFNGEFIPVANPNYNTVLEKTTPDFAACSFVLDGKDTLWDANLQKSVGAVLSGADYGGVLKTQGDTLSLAKIIIWDDATPIEDARPIELAWSTYAALPAFINDEGGFFPITPSELRYYNYPMSFDPDAWAINGLNLWGFNQIDKPASNKKTNIAFEYKLQYCCAYNSIELYMSTLFESGEGEINFIEYDYGTREVTIKGNIK